jgi:hypothetical protein
MSRCIVLDDGIRVYSKRAGSKPPPDAVYVGRPTVWGNPFVVGVHGAQGECVELYRRWIQEDDQASLRERAQRELRGRSLVCWCAPLPCHADVLMEVANSA